MILFSKHSLKFKQVRCDHIESKLHYDNGKASLEQVMMCKECQRTFSRETDRKRHRCVVERAESVSWELFTILFVTNGFVELVDFQFTNVCLESSP